VGESDRFHYTRLPGDVLERLRRDGFAGAGHPRHRRVANSTPTRRATNLVTYSLNADNNLRVVAAAKAWTLAIRPGSFDDNLTSALTSHWVMQGYGLVRSTRLASPWTIVGLNHSSIVAIINPFGVSGPATSSRRRSPCIDLLPRVLLRTGTEMCEAIATAIRGG
jgi:hypothetical protein